MRTISYESRITVTFDDGEVRAVDITMPYYPNPSYHDEPIDVTEDEGDRPTQQWWDRMLKAIDRDASTRPAGAKYTWSQR